MKSNLSRLHCGACDRNFDDIEDLKVHINSCQVARCLLPMIYLVASGVDKMGHPISRLIQNVKRHKSSITNYAYAIADARDTFTRSKLHLEMCKNLDLDYNVFRPFESSSITKLPKRDEALDYLYDEICKHAISEMCKKEIES